MPASYLEKLNSAQRCAAEHGMGPASGGIAGPLLVIAGAGSGKTNTLAHRVAHLIVGGADPRKIPLMTFSRRGGAREGEGGGGGGGQAPRGEGGTPPPPPPPAGGGFRLGAPPPPRR